MMRLATLLLLLATVLSGCSSVPPRMPPPHEARSRGLGRVVAAAERVVGVPYRYGGDSPLRGFDCSGLIHYAYGRAGLRVPRTTRGLYAAVRRIPLNALQPGDVLFFRIEGKPSHVALYVGGQQFVHAPSSGERVRYGSLRNPYWRRRLVMAGRF